MGVEMRSLTVIDGAGAKAEGKQAIEPPRRYPLAPNGVFRTLQGEGVLLGTPMVFIRLAGCSIGCAECDTDYRVDRRLSLSELIDLISRVKYGGVKWVWLTGGEPTDHDIPPLVRACHSVGLRVALATAGVRRVQQGSLCGGVDFLSVSPHSLEKWVQKTGDQLNVVPGLNGLSLKDLEGVDVSGFPHRFVTPLYGVPESMDACANWVMAHAGWRLGIQAHKVWGVA